MKQSSKQRERFGLIGAGKVGTFFLSLLKRKGFHIAGISDKDKRQAKKVYQLLRIEYRDLTNREVASLSDVLLCGTPDDVILEVYNEIRNDLKPNSIFCHFSGSLSRDAFPSDGFILSLHPVYPFTRETKLAEFSKFVFALEGDETAVKFGRRLVKALGGRYIKIPTEEKDIHHLACVFASNFLLAILAVAFNLVRGKRHSYLYPLASQSLLNAFRSCPDERYPFQSAITGPIVRGDKKTIERHIKVLSENFPKYLPLYKNLSQVIFDLVKEQIPPKKRKEIARLIRNAECGMRNAEKEMRGR